MGIFFPFLKEYSWNCVGESITKISSYHNPEIPTNFTHDSFALEICWVEGGMPLAVRECKGKTKSLLFCLFLKAQ